MRRFFLPLFLALSAAALGFVVVSAGALPERVASHFARGGLPNGWMTRGSYLTVVAFSATLLPLATVLLLSVVTRVLPRALNMPNRDYWLAPERREATRAALAGFGWAFACILTLFFAGIHWTILDAHTNAPPRLAEAPVHALVIGFAIAVAVWVVALILRFRSTLDGR
jgi:uncharacterized membrane protein